MDVELAAKYSQPYQGGSARKKQRSESREEGKAEATSSSHKEQARDKGDKGGKAKGKGKGSKNGETFTAEQIMATEGKLLAKLCIALKRVTSSSAVSVESKEAAMPKVEDRGRWL